METPPEENHPQLKTPNVEGFIGVCQGVCASGRCFTSETTTQAGRLDFDYLLREDSLTEFCGRKLQTGDCMRQDIEASVICASPIAD